MVVVRWCFTVFFIVIALAIDVGNACAPIIARRRGRNVSGVPFMGTVSGVAACLVCPVAGTAKLIPLAVLADLSTYYLAWMIVAVVVARREHRK